MFKKIAIFLFFAVQLQASLFDWMNPISSQAKHAQKSLEGFDEVVKQALKDYQVPGVAIGIVVDGHVVYAKGFGYRDIEKKLPITPDTLFPIGSCSKAFTSFVIGTLVDEGVFAWDTPIVDLLPEFRLWDLYATQNLTIRDLLVHRCGLPRHDFMWYNSNMSRSECMGRLKYLQPSAEIRERYQYNNLMYLAAAYAMEQVLGKTWEEAVSSRILNPLEMRHTNFSIEKLKSADDFASGYIEKENALQKMPFRNVDLLAPAAGINSNISDLSRWVQMHLDQGVFEKRVLISSATLQEIHSPHIMITGVPEAKEVQMYSAAMGWKIGLYRGQYYVSHDGGVDGFTSVVGFLPQQKVGIIILANKNITACPRYISLEAIDRILSLPRLNWLQNGIDGLNKNKETQNAQESQENVLRKKETSPSHSLEEYVGEYVHPGYGTAMISLVEGELQMTFHGITSILDHWHYDVFTISRETQELFLSRAGTKLSFSTGVNGEIEHLAIPFEPQVDDIIFKKKSFETFSSFDYMRRFVGPYEIYGYTVEVVIRNQVLSVIIPGEPVYELTPTVQNEFVVKTLAGYKVRFVFNKEDQVSEVLLIQPYGTFSATPKRYAMK